MSLQGQIEETGLGPIIQTLSLNRYRGTLRIETEAGSRFFFISEGEIVLVRQVKQEPVRLGDLLVRAGHLTEEQLEQALAEQKRLENTVRLGDALAQMEMVTPDQIEAAVRGKFEEDFLDLFLLDKGRFEFIFGLTPESLFGPEERLERITLSTESLMMEAMRRVDEWQDMISRLGSFDTIYRNRAQSIGTPIESYNFENVNLPKQARIDLYNLLDGTRSLREVIGEALGDGIASRLETFQYLHALEQNQLVKPMDFKTLLGEAKDALGSGEVQNAAKYIRAILTRKEKLDLGLVKRYLEFLRKQQRPRLAFDEARRFAAQALADGDSGVAITLYEEAIDLYETPEVIDRLFYALLRANKRQRAVAVGLKLRDFLQSENDLGVATRVCQNLQELDPNNPEVLELWGLILKRRERNEDAVEALDRALAGLPSDHPRRGPVVEALLQLQPHRNELRDEQELIDLQNARIQLSLERRRRWISVAATLVGAIVVVFLFAEVRSRGLVSAAEEQLTKEDTGPDDLRRAGELLGGVSGFTLASFRAGELRAQIHDRWTELSKEAAERGNELIKLKEAERAAKTRREEREKRLEAVRSALASYRSALTSDDYEAASKIALATQESYGEVEDPGLAAQVKDLKIYARFQSEPEADVVVLGKVVGRTPYALPLTPGSAVTVRLRRTGCRRIEFKLDGSAYVAHEAKLEPGPAWELDLGAAPLPVASRSDAVLVATGESLRCVDAGSGGARWKVKVPGQGDLAGVAMVADVAIATRGKTASGYSLEGGEREWSRELELDVAATAPGHARVLNQEVVLIAGGRTVLILDAATGATLLSVSGLPSEASGAPTGGEGFGFVPLRDRVVGFPLAGGGKRRSPFQKLAQRWEAKVVASGPIRFGETAEAVLVPVAKNTQLRLLGARTGVATPVAPGLGALVGVTTDKGTIYCLGSNGQLSSFRGDGLEILAGKPVVSAASGGPVFVNQDVVLVDDQGQLSRYSRTARRRDDPPIGLGGPVTQPLQSAGRAVVAVIGNKVVLVELLDKE